MKDREYLIFALWTIVCSPGLVFVWLANIFLKFGEPCVEWLVLSIIPSLFFYMCLGIYLTIQSI